MKLVNVSKIYKTKYNETKALDDINLSFDNTGFVFILGESGSGKSTLLNMISTLDKPSSGSIYIGDTDITKLKEKNLDYYRNSYISLVFQEYNLIPDLTVFENINLVINDEEKSINALKQVDLYELKNRKINEISGGQKQRVAIARSLVMDTKVILLDEPTAALDSKTGEDIIILLKEISKEKLVIAVTHDEEIALKYNDRLIEIADGKIIKDTFKSKNTNNVEIKKQKRNIPLKYIFKLAISNIINYKLKLFFQTILLVLSLIILGLLINVCTTTAADRILHANIKNNITSSCIYDKFFENDLINYDCIKCYNTSIPLSIKNKSLYDNVQIQGYANIDNNTLKEFNLNIKGALPENDYEIAITNHLADIIKRNYNISDLINSNIKLADIDYKITGIISTTNDLNKFESLKEKSDEELYNSYINHLLYSLELYLYVKDVSLYNNYIDSKYNIPILSQDNNRLYKNNNINLLINQNGAIVIPIKYFKNIYSFCSCNFVIDEISYNNYYDLFIKLLEIENINIDEYSKYNDIYIKYNSCYNFPIDLDILIDFNDNNQSFSNTYKIKGFSYDDNFSLIESEFNILINEKRIGFNYNSIIINNSLIDDFSNKKILTPYSEIIYSITELCNSLINIFIFISIFVLLFTLLIIIKNITDTVLNKRKSIGIMKSLGINYKSIYLIYIFDCLFKLLLTISLYIILIISIISIINTIKLSINYTIDVLLISKIPIISIFAINLIISLLSIIVSISKIKKISIIDCINRP